MAMAAEFVPIRLAKADEKTGRARMREMLGRNWWRRRGRAAWAGFAAELAYLRAFDGGPGLMLTESPTREVDLCLSNMRSSLGVEVKTRAVSNGWVHPDKFDYITVPMHDGREPVKDAADQVWFAWYSMSTPRVLWALGYVRGVEEFKRRAQWYAEGDPLPRGGWARDGGAYVIEVKQLRPFPANMFNEEAGL